MAGWLLPRAGARYPSGASTDPATLRGADSAGAGAEGGRCGGSGGASERVERGDRGGGRGGPPGATGAAGQHASRQRRGRAREGLDLRRLSPADEGVRRHGRRRRRGAEGADPPGRGRRRGRSADRGGWQVDWRDRCLRHDQPAGRPNRRGGRRGAEVTAKTLKKYLTIALVTMSVLAPWPERSEEHTSE